MAHAPGGALQRAAREGARGNTEGLAEASWMRRKRPDAKGSASGGGAEVLAAPSSRGPPRAGRPSYPSRRRRRARRAHARTAGRGARGARCAAADPARARGGRGRDAGRGEGAVGGRAEQCGRRPRRAAAQGVQCGRRAEGGRRPVIGAGLGREAVTGAASGCANVAAVAAWRWSSEDDAGARAPRGGATARRKWWTRTASPRWWEPPR